MLTMSSIDDRIIPDTTEGAGIRQQNEMNSVDGGSDAANTRDSITDAIASRSPTNVAVRNNDTSDEPLGFPSVGISSAHARTDSWLEEQVARSSSYSLLHDAAAAVSNDGKTVTSIILPEIPCLVDSGLDAQIAGLCTRRGLMYNRLIQQIHIVEQLLDSSNVDMMNAEVANVDRKLSDFMEVNDRC